MKRSRKQPGLTSKARTLRRNSTPGERKLWDALVEIQKATGVRFHRQKPIGQYIADFYCPAYKCVIEIDGMSHETRLEKDKKRDAYMAEIGLHVLRFSEADTQAECETVAQTILSSMRGLSK